MKLLLNRIIDRFQETFPPNRIVILLTPIAFIPVAGTVTAWTAVHFPGLELSEGLVIGLASAAALGAFSLAYKWLDQWQRGEPIHAEADIDRAIGEVVDSPEVQRALQAAGELEVVHANLEDLRLKLGEDRVNLHQVIAQLGSITDEISGFLHGLSNEEPQDAAAPQ